MNTTILNSKKIKNTEISTEGGVCKKYFATYNKSKVMLKGTYKKDIEAFNELFAYKFLTRLGFKVNKVKVVETKGLKILLKNSESEKCNYASVHIWNENFSTISSTKIDTSKANEKYKSMVFAMRVFDNVIGNYDRHGDNYGIDEKTGYLFLIDNGLSSPYNNYLMSHLGNLIKNNQDEFIAKTSPLKRIIKRFFKLTREDFEKIVKDFPETLVADNKTYKLAIVDSMLKKQEALKEVLKGNSIKL